MRQTIILLMVISISVLFNPVNAKDFKVGLTVTPLGENDVFRFVSIDGGGSCFGDGFYVVGITCQTPLTSRLDMEIGFEYSKHTILAT